MLGMSDCLWGLLDGVNDAGLAVSLTFGGRRDVGDGFGDPARRALPARDLRRRSREAREALARIPVHAPQNLTLLDRSGAYLTAYVGPGPRRPSSTPSRRRPTTRARSSGRSTRGRSAPSSASSCVLDAARRPGADARALRRGVPRAAAAQHRATRRASARSTPPPTTRPRAAPSTAGRASRGSSRSTASRRRGTRETFTPRLERHRVAARRLLRLAATAVPANCAWMPSIHSQRALGQLGCRRSASASARRARRGRRPGSV